MPTKKGNDYKSVVSSLIAETHRLLGEVIRDTEPSDSRAKSQQAPWTDRHRLQVLLEAAKENQKKPNVAVAPWFLAELAATLDVVRIWNKSPYWQDIEKSLKDRDAFNHTIAMLHVAEHIKMDGHTVQIVKEGRDPSPDLMLNARGGTQEAVVIECYQPVALSGKPSNLNNKEAANIIETAMKKAKRQMGDDKPGIIAICGYNQSIYNLRLLKQVAANRLSKTERINFWGIWLMTLGVMFNKKGNETSFQAMRSAEFIQSPAYFGKVDIVASVPTNHQNLIKGNLRYIKTNAFIAGTTEKKEARDYKAILPDKARVPYVKEVKLKTIQQPGEHMRSVIHGIGGTVPPLFKGQGNINYQCGQCGVVLADHAWKQSLCNVVIQCPNCQSYNETENILYKDFSTVELTPGNFNFSDAVILKSGRCLRGR